MKIKSRAKKKDKINRRREWRLELPLKIAAEGTLPRGKKFKEKTTLANISSDGAYFYLDAALTIGSKLQLIINLPKKLTEGKSLKLCLGGEVIRLEKMEKMEKRQGVAIRFDEEFKGEEFRLITEKK